MTDKNRSIFEALRANLKRSENALISAQKRQSAHIRELCRVMRNSFPTSFEEEAGEEFRKKYTDAARELELSREGRIEFSRYMPAECGYTSQFSLAHKLLGAKPKRKKCRISYVKNPISDIAYDIFSEAFEACTVSYANDFISAAEDVYYSKADYAILPIHSSNTGRMAGFAAIIEKYELKGVLSCCVYSMADESETDFLLLSKSIELFFSPKDEDICIQILLSDPSEKLLPVMSAAQRYGAPCLSVYTEGDKAELILDITKADVNSLCLYLFLELPRHTVQGMFVHY